MHPELRRLNSYLKKISGKGTGTLNLDEVIRKFPKYRFIPFKTFGQVFNKDGWYAHYDNSMYVEGPSGAKCTMHWREYINFEDLHLYLGH